MIDVLAVSHSPESILKAIELVYDIKFVFNLNTDWKDFYRNIVEEDHHLMPEILGKSVYVGCFVDGDHGVNVIISHEQSGIFLFVNNALINSFRNKQNTVESSIFGSELVVLRIAGENIVDIRINLKMIRVPLDVSVNIFCNNNGVVNNTSIPEHTLSKKHSTINYHCVREADASGILSVRKEDKATKFANPLPEFLPYSQK